MAEALSEGGWLAKGCEVYAEGRLTVGRWESNGEPRSGLELAAFVVQVLGVAGRRSPSDALLRVSLHDAQL
jgi:single-stranded DNA-binding protein